MEIEFSKPDDIGRREMKVTTDFGVLEARIGRDGSYLDAIRFEPSHILWVAIKSKLLDVQHGR